MMFRLVTSTFLHAMNHKQGQRTTTFKLLPSPRSLCSTKYKNLMVNRAVESDCQRASSIKLLKADKLRRNSVMLGGEDKIL